MRLDPLLAFGFLTWGFFWAGLGLVSVPILIHLLNRRRFKVVSWAAMEFLLRAMRKNRRRLRFEQWLLLATRCMLVFLLGLALARPLGCESGAMAQFGRRTALNVFVVDNSYSMGYEARHPDAKTHLDQARKLVKAILSRPSSGGESVVLITAGRPATAVIARPQFDLEEAKAAVDRIEQSYGSTDLSGALELALKVGRDEVAQPNKNLYILTDATRSAWEGSQSQSIKQLGPDLARLYHVTHFDLAAGQPQQWNASVLAIAPSSNLVTTKFQTDFKAVVKGFGSSHDGSLQWKLDDQVLEGGAPSLHLDAATPDQTQSKARFTTGGPHVIAAQLSDGDRLPSDDTRWRVVDVASELKVLIVEGKRGINPLEGSGAFLSAALAPLHATDPGKPPTSDSYVSPELITDLELGNKVLTDYSAVILTGVGSLTPAQADAIARFVQQGGTLMLFMGDAVNKENYNSVLLPRNLLPGPLVKLMSVGTNEKPFFFDFKPNGNVHRFLDVFRNQENTGLDTAAIFNYWQVDPRPNLNVERVLNYLPPEGKSVDKGEDPAITVHSVGEGRVVFVSTSANPDWTSFPQKQAYLPLMHELLDGSVRSGDRWMNLEVGQPLEIPQTVRVTATPTLTDPTGAALVVDPENKGGVTLYHTQPLKKPGVYKLSLGGRQVPIAVNVPAADEANVTTLADDSIRHALGDIEVSLQGADLPADALAGRQGNDFSWWCMMAVLGLLCVECFMAMKFGHYHRSETDAAPGSAPATPTPARRTTLGAAR
jgi:hypothetical protein